MDKFIDISPEISSATAVFPGDKSFTQKMSLSFEKGDHLRLSAITTTTHIGAHADAPSHYHAKGQTIENRALDYYIGSCQVISAKAPRGQRIGLEHLSTNSILAPRVLIKTGSFPDPNQWNQDFNAVSLEVIEHFNQNQVKLVGIDTPSVDLADDKQLFVHHAIYEYDMAILEGIVLDQVIDGLYELIALPLKIKNGDASPVRAILKNLNKDHDAN